MIDKVLITIYNYFVNYHSKFDNSLFLTFESFNQEIENLKSTLEGYLLSYDKSIDMENSSRPRDRVRNYLNENWIKKIKEPSHDYSNQEKMESIFANYIKRYEDNRSLYLEYPDTNISSQSVLDEFKNYYLKKYEFELCTLSKVKDLLGKELLNPQDTIIVNFNGSRIVKLFIIGTRNIIKIHVNHCRLSERIVYIIQRDIKKLRLEGELVLELHFHGNHVPEIIELGSYDEAVALQDLVSQLRDRRSYKN